MNVIQLEATQGTVFSFVVSTDVPLAGATASMTIVQGNCLDSAVSAQGPPGAVLASLTPGLGLAINAVAGTITATISAVVTALWPPGWASAQMFVVPSVDNRTLCMQALIWIADDFSTP